MLSELKNFLFEQSKDMSVKLRSLLAMVFAVFLLAGCEANGVDPDVLADVGGGGSGSPGSPTDTRGCAVPLGDSLCVLGGEDHPGGLVDVLLAEDGPLGPIAGAIDTDALVEALTVMLENDGDLASLVESLIAGGQLQEGLELLLLGENGDGQGALAETLQSLLAGNAEGQGLLALFGEEGIAGLVQALLVDGTSGSCQAPLGTLCLISGDGSQMGLLDLLLTSDGVLGALAPHLTDEVTDQIVATLGDLLESNGSLSDLLQGLIQEGQLVEALQVLLIGDPEQGVASGLVQALQGLLSSLGVIVTDILEAVGGILGV